MMTTRKKSEISLIAVDLDGTLLTSDGVLASMGAGVLKQVAQRGVYVVLSTTRNPDSVQSFCRQLEINDPIICTNGAQVWGSPEGPVWAHHSIPVEVALTIAQLADKHQWELSITVDSMTYWRQRSGQALGQIAPNITVVAANSDAITGEPVRVLTWHPDAIEGIRLLCQSKFVSQCYTETYYKPNGQVHSLAVFAAQADKGKALALVLERLGVGREKVVAIGDNPNDVPMFGSAGVSVAMGNAPDEVKQKATLVAPSNDEEGVAWALEALGVSRVWKVDIGYPGQGVSLS